MCNAKGLDICAGIPLVPLDFRHFIGDVFISAHSDFLFVNLL
jgi:hypothetical protein